MLPKLIVRDQYIRLLDLSSLLPFSGLKFFTIYDESDAEEEYTVKEMSDYNNKM